MVELNPLSGSAGSAVSPANRQSFDQARQAKVRAALFQSGETVEEKRALSRLEAFLSAGRPPRSAVPRGFYLNISV